ncbi:hypothetical protein BSKO_09432 [Bryopsis sp. KO-2023]|nr:hypothetical protein BSKO_09432 [Bryopsis sp. KO-2023]
MYRTIQSTGASLVVRGLPEPITADDLKEAYGGFGEVVCAEVKHVGEGKYVHNTGYVTFALDSAATNAQSATDGRTIDCKHCTVILDVAFGQATERPIDNPPGAWGRDRYSTRNVKPDHDRKVFVRSFPVGFSEAQLADLFKECGPIEYAEIRLHKGYSFHQNHNPRPYGFVCFERVEAAVEAVRSMNGFTPPSSNCHIVVDFARPHRPHPKRGMGRGGPGGHRGRDSSHRGGAWLSGSRNGRMFGRKSSFFASNGGDRLETGGGAAPPYHETHAGSATNENGNNQNSGLSYGGSPGDKMLKKNEWKVMEQKKKNGGRHKN